MLLIHQEEKCHGGAYDTYGHRWQAGDVVGVCLDLVDRTVSEYYTEWNKSLYKLSNIT